MNRFESGPTKEVSPESQKNNEIFLRMQAELLQRAGCTPEDNDECAEWIAQHAEDLRNLVNRDPKILSEWEAHPEETAKRVEAQINASHSHSH
ncbi:MAG: hypothetical protein A3J08_02180 [Candidatus Lloydbacteria bacterium RIFCSPLOWO2_02_FULL_51_11]|uniref:Uncharacterized protein n=1 Tax=Candidatus Lloydbacteria bacterium RIFCSPLOWO2_02_FULL_51_11 TaxID=1798667 RepID=A0A1G2DLF5_9BACT|nr:MAG: hypothetical protein A3J08_02180 [Candidatus Lloydbacteria bacterium RIFCSPLOWO2_02_FULL_51_11]